MILPPVRFPKPLFGELHFREGGLGGAVPAGHQLLPLPQRLFLLADVAGDAAQRAPASATIFDRCEGCHQVTSRRSCRSCSLTCP